MNNYLNVIQLICGVLAAVFIFLGLFTSLRKLNKEDSSQLIPKENIIRSTIFIAIGLLLYSAMKTCTAYASAPEEDLFMMFTSSLVDVVKFFGFLLILPFLFNYLKKKTVRNVPESTDEEDTEGISDED